MTKITRTDGRTCIAHTDADGITQEYRTDRTGNGLWVWRQGAAEWKQIIGSGQITLSGTRSTIRSRFIRAMAAA